MINVSKMAEMPKEKHWAAIAFDYKSIYHDYGKYDSHTENFPYMIYYAFKTKDELETWLVSQDLSKYKILEVNPATTKKVVTVKINEEN